MITQDAQTGLLRPTRQTIIGALLGGAATASGIALTATSGWLIVRASEEPIILTLMVAIVAVRTFGIARPFFRYLERLVSHDAALDDLAVRRTSVYAALIPLTPARLGRRSRSRVLTGVVDDLTDVVEAQVRVTVPLLSSALAALVAVLLTAWFSPAIGLVLAGLMVAVAGTCWLAWVFESHSRDELLESRAEVLRISDLVARQAAELQAIGATATAAGWLDAAHDTLRRAVQRQSRGGGGRAAGGRRGTAAARSSQRRCSWPPPWRPCSRPCSSTRPSPAARSRPCWSSCRWPSATPWRPWSTPCATSLAPRAVRCGSRRCSTRSPR